MENIDYNKLYQLQNNIFDILFKTENIFYLTGGTCLSRFYQAKRYSDDLDFFADNSIRFNFAVRKVRIAFEKTFNVKVINEARDFVRLMVNELLQVDFVNEKMPHLKDVIITNDNYIIDNVENILSNKITSIIYRDNPKDIFDIYLIWKYYNVDWKEIMASAHEKLHFNDEDLLIRLKTFPVQSIYDIKLIDVHFLDNFEKEFPELIDSIR